MLRLVFLFTAVLHCPFLYCATENAASADGTPTEYEVKAAYVYYFAKFVNWPDDAFAARNAPILIGVVGDDEFGSLLEKVVKNKTIQEHPISVRILKWPADLRSCQMIYIGASETKRSRQIIDAQNGHSVLTVTEADSGSPVKGIMNLLVEGGKVQFEADIAAAERCRLQISSKLLRLARAHTITRLSKGE